MVSGTVLAAVLIVLGAAMLSGFGFLLFVRVAPRMRVEGRNDVTSVYFSMVGVLYAILLAFVVVVAWEQFNSAAGSTQAEVTRLSNVWRDAGGLDPADRDLVRRDLRNYLVDVIDDEYETMAKGEPSEVARASYARVWAVYYDITPGDDVEAAFFAESLARLNELGEARRLRLLSSESTIPVPLWILLIGGGIFTITWLYLFWMDSIRVQVWLISTVGGFTGFILFLIFALQHPFDGDVAVSSDVYRDLLDTWRL